MRPRLSILCLLLFGSIFIARSSLVYVLTTVNLPEAESSRAVGLNDSGTLLGVAQVQNVSRPFIWRTDFASFLNPPRGQEAIPYAINNRDEVVGSALVVNIYRPWLYSNGISSILGPEPSYREDDAARAINDDGGVVGNVGPIGYLLAPEVRAFPQVGGGPCWSGATRLFAVDNSGAVLGTVDGGSVRWPSFKDLSRYENLPINATAVRGSFVAGSANGAPAVLRGTNLVALSAPANAGTVLAINDAGVMVGEARDSHTALIWNGSLAVELGTLVQLPIGARLVSPVAINQRGQIAATLLRERTASAVLLTPSTKAGLKPLSVEMPPKAVFKTPSVQLPVRLDGAAGVTEVSYTTYRLSMIPAFGVPDCGWTPARIEWTPIATNVLTASPYLLSLTNLSPGQYSYEAAVRDREGAVTHSFPGFFVVAGRPALRVQRSWWNDLEVALDGSPGYLQVLEVSTDLLHWTPLTNVPPTDGLLHQESTAQWQKNSTRFYRGRVVAEDVAAWGYSPSLTAPPYLPDQLTSVRMQLSYDAGERSTVIFNTPSDGLWDDQFPFTYQWSPRALRIELAGGDWRSTITLHLTGGPSFPPFGPGWNAGSFREDLTLGATTTSATGTYHIN